MARSSSTAAGSRGSDGDPTAVIGRIPPHDLEAEKAVLSALLIDNAAIHSVLNEVSPDDFYHPSHQTIYKAMLALQDENEPVDLHTLSDHLNAAKKLDRVGGLELARISVLPFGRRLCVHLLGKPDVTVQPVALHSGD